jgi:hypothetical protein
VTSRYVSRAVKVVSAILLIAGASAAQAAVISLGGVSQGAYGFSHAIDSRELATGYDVLGIHSFSAGLERSGPAVYASPTPLASHADTKAVPEAEPWVMVLMAFGIVVYQLHRKQRSLEQPPARVLSA